MDTVVSDRAAEKTATHEDMANAIRALAMDAVQQANSGHPGMPMGMADVATVLFGKFLKFDPKQPDWPDRDRFVLSAGHGSMLLYALLHLTGHEDMTLEELRNFRQLGSRTAGHPEYGHAAGIETTTGPLGQGLGNSVGMALAERLLAARFGEEVVDHHTYVIAGDGCLMEGLSHEAIALAGHLQLSKLIVFFDDNSISIDGPVELADSVDQAKRFEACGWHVQSIDGHDPAAIEKAIAAARKSDKPAMIACKTVIGYGAPNKQGTASTHGSPLGEEEIAAARKQLGWNSAPFEIPAPIAEAWRGFGARGAKQSEAWQKRLAKLADAERAEFERRLAGDLPEGLEDAIVAFKKQASEAGEKVATRVSSQKVLDVLAPLAPELLGGSADLTGSNNTKAGGQQVVKPGDFSGSYIHYGVREHGMAAAMNGLALHRGVIPYGGTFLVFTDYCRPSIRLSALMGQRVIYVMTHDSIGLGEDGPTHQPVEHLAALRAIPNLKVFRPCDSVETAECWELALKNADGPSVLALTRQGVPVLRREHNTDNWSQHGAYILEAADSHRQATLLASGSEVSVAIEAKHLLEEEGIACAVVSIPSWELFMQQPAHYRDEVLGPGTLQIAVEAASPFGWEKWVGLEGTVVGMRGFGASAPAGELYKHFRITPEEVAATVREWL